MSRRDEILAIAAKTIAENGLAGATVRQIGQAAGILSGSLYYHFDSKEQIVVELLTETLGSQQELAHTILDETSNSIEALEALIDSSIRETAARPHQALIVRNETRQFEESEALKPVAELRAVSLRMWVDVVETGIKNGEIQDHIIPDIAVRGIFDSVLGAARWFMNDSPYSVDQIIESLVAIHVRGLAAE
jgi:AcrR family transcriptional regulator